MSKTRKWARWWFAPWEYRQAEAWLEDYAAKGWRIDSFGLIFTVFKKCEPAQVKYKCVLTDTSIEEEEKLKDAYKAAGWKYVDKKLDLLVFSQEAPDSALSDPTDEEKQFILSRRSLRGKSIRFLVSLIAFVFISLVYYHIFSSPISLVDFSIKDELIIILIFSWFLSYWISCGYAIKMTICNIESGEQICRNQYQTSKVSISRKICYVVVFLMLIPGLRTVLNLKTMRIPTSPAFRISDIVSDDKTISFVENTEPQFSTIEYGILFPYHKFCIDTMSVTSVNESMDSNIHISYDIYRALTPQLAEILAGQLTWFWLYSEKGGQSSGSSSFQKYWKEDSEDSDFHTVLALRGCYVYCIRLIGPIYSDEILEFLEKR